MANSSCKRLTILICVALAGTACKGSPDNDPPADDARPGDRNAEDSGTESATSTVPINETDTPSHVDSATDTWTEAPVPDTGTARDAGEPDTNHPEAIEDLTIEPNPNNVLSCFVSWRTASPATSVVEFGEDAYAFRISDDTRVRDHRVLVIGMREARTYRIKAISTGNADFGTAYRESEFTTEPLPDIVPRPELVTFDPSRANTGWTLFPASSAADSPPPPSVITMIDEEGVPVWYFINGDQPDDRGDVDVRLQPNGTITVGPTAHQPAVEVDLAGNVVWTGPEQGLFEVMHHHFDKLPDGNYLGLRRARSADFTGDRVQIIQPDHEVLMDWNIFSYLTPAPGDRADWSHANSITVDPTGGVFYLSCRNFESILKVSLLGDQSIIWTFGDGGDFAPDSNAAEPWFYHQHDPEIQEDGTILLYDNGSSARGYSRVVQYALDEVNMTSEIIWEFPGDFTDIDEWYTDVWYTAIFGDADRLPNDNVLVTAGTGELDVISRIFEVTPDGEVVWAATVPPRAGFATGVYRAERLAPPPLVRRIEN